MLSLERLTEIGKRRLNLLTDRLYTVPVLVLMPHSRCNARCLMCDIWKDNDNKRELSEAEIEAHLDEFRALGVQRVIFSGGEALMHPNLFSICEILSRLPQVKLTLLSTGLTLEKHAVEVAGWFDEVTVSLDGPPAIHDQVRNIPRAYDKLAAGVRAVKAAGGRRVTGRSVVQRNNFRFMDETIEGARAAGLDEISFLPVDMSSEAFNRPGGWSDERADQTALSKDEAFELRDRIEELIAKKGADFASGFIAERPAKMRALAQHFLYHHGITAHAATNCNAPWVSAVIEADGTVRPCFFHKSIGNFREAPLAEILNGPEAIRFRRELDVNRDPTCVRCVCTLSVGPRTEV